MVPAPSESPGKPVSLDELRWKLQWFRRQQLEFESRAAFAGNKLPRSDAWRLDYYRHPYLAGASDEVVQERFCDVFMNVCELNVNGQIAPRSDGTILPFMAEFTHVLEESGSRGGVSFDTINEARAPFLKYYQNGSPLGQRLFRNAPSVTSPILVKYGQRVHLESMLNHGLLRIGSASDFAKATYSTSLRDTETQRLLCIPTYKERLEGISYIEIASNRLPISNSDPQIIVEVPDYYLYCLCEQVHYRLPTDFGYEAALIIWDRNRFVQLAQEAFARLHPNWVARSGPVRYYDPYLNAAGVQIPEMAKHFRYAYQKEFRLAFSPQDVEPAALEPFFFMEIGSMRDYAELLVT